MGNRSVPADRRQRPRAGAPMLPARLAVLALGTPGPRRGLIKKEKRLELNSVIVRISNVSCELEAVGQCLPPLPTLTRDGFAFLLASALGS